MQDSSLSHINENPYKVKSSPGTNTPIEGFGFRYFNSIWYLTD